MPTAERDPKLEAAFAVQRSLPIIVAIRALMAEVSTRFEIDPSECHWVISTEFKREFSCAGICEENTRLRSEEEFREARKRSLRAFRIHGIIAHCIFLGGASLAQLYCGHMQLATIQRKVNEFSYEWHVSESVYQF